jgi:hypothetical protein
MAEMDLELAALFNLSDSVVPRPRCSDFDSLDKFFESSDLGIDPDALTKADDGLQEIRIEPGTGKIVREYRTVNAYGDETVTLEKRTRRDSRGRRWLGDRWSAPGQ